MNAHAAEPQPGKTKPEKTKPGKAKKAAPMRVTLFGNDIEGIRPIVEKHRAFAIVDDAPDFVICYGGDGTLLSAEHTWPGVPKVPVRNSRRGNRLIAKPVQDVLERLERGALHSNEFIKLDCTIRAGDTVTQCPPAMNEFNVHMARINSAVRFECWFNDQPVEEGEEIIGDGFVVSTPFGSTAYFKQITRGMFYTGLGVAFKLTTEHMNHFILPEDIVVRFRITRGPAVLALDNSDEFFELHEGHELLIQKSPASANILTWHHLDHPRDPF